MTERMAINAPIQGTEADIIKIAMVRVDDYLKKESLTEKIKLILQAHDELVYEADENIVKKVAPEIEKIMKSVISAKESKGVIMEASGSVGDNWKEMEKIIY
jgi:DNA polymerase-1